MCFDGRLSFQESYNAGYGVFWRNGDEKVYMIGWSTSFKNFAFFLPCQLFEHCADQDAYISIEYFLAVLGYNDNMVFAVIHCMTLRL